MIKYINFIGNKKNKPKTYFNAYIFIALMSVLILSGALLLNYIIVQEKIDSTPCGKSRVLGLHNVEMGEKLLFNHDCTVLGLTNDGFPYNLIGEYEDVKFNERQGVVKIIFHTFRPKDSSQADKYAAYFNVLEYYYVVNPEGKVMRLIFVGSSTLDAQNK